MIQVMNKSKMKTKEVRVVTAPVEIREMEDDKPAKVVGYAAMYSRASEDMGFIETIEPGAFVGADTTDVRALINHDQSKILGRTSAGTLTVNIDEVGLRYELELPNTSYARDLAESLRRKDITQSSFAFSDVDDNWEERDGKWFRSITKIRKLYDVSPVTYPAYTDTTVAMRSLEAVQAVNEEEEEASETPDDQLRETHLRLRLASKRYR